MPTKTSRPLIRKLLTLAWLLSLAAVVVLAAMSTPAVASWLVRYVSDGAPVASSAIVVLGGQEKGLAQAGDAALESSPRTRLGVGRQLLLSHRAPVILVSGGKGEATWMKAQLVAQGVPASRILAETRSRNTHENAVYSAPILRRIGAHRILLVTSRFHMRRAAGCFRKLGLEVIPVASPQLLESKSGGNFWRVRGRALKRSEACLYEVFGLWVYECLGWA
jgi:uncharacterized SAM-binding protein YcdF (DUF218 family)